MRSTTTSSGSTSKRAFARHFAEMLAAMPIGMGVLMGLAALGFAATSSSLSDQPGALRVMLMGLSMTAQMVLWMTHRGYSAHRNMEMAASMPAPTAASG